MIGKAVKGVKKAFKKKRKRKKAKKSLLVKRKQY